MKNLLSSFEKVPLIQAPTPLFNLNTLTKAHGYPLWVKRDDLCGVGTGGNKVRKLEYLLADAKKSGASSVVTGGGVQSNHAAATAICANKLGLHTFLALTESVPIKNAHYNENGNILINQLCGATTKRFANGTATNACIDQYANEIEKETGNTPYKIVMGGSSALGALGYVNAALELSEQLKQKGIRKATVIHASGSAGTQSGLIVGAALADIDLKIIGCSVLHPRPVLTTLVNDLCIDIARLLRLNGIDWGANIHIEDGYIGDGYGMPSYTTWQSIQTGINAESLICDPCYSGKAFNYFLDLTKSAASAAKTQLSGDAIFLMTGGLIGMMGYQQHINALR